MKKRAVLIPLAVLAGFSVGRFGASFSSVWGDSPGGAADMPENLTEDSRAGRDASKPGAAVIPRRLVSTETLESILEQGDAVTYASLALWLVDAEAAEIAEYWRSFEEPNWDMKRLLFMNWTRIDPHGALAATEGSKFAKMAWWSWASNDPAAAMAAVGSGDYMSQVADGLGQSQPAWLIEHFDELPEAARNSAFNGLATWKETDDPAGILDFLLEKGRGFQPHIFKNFARKDPWAAYEWLRKNGKLGLSAGGDGGVGILIREMVATSPDDLGRMAAMTPAGQLKRRMEDAAFGSLMKSDPDKAYENARKTEAPLFAAKRMAMIAAGYLDSDPEKAFLIAGEILAKAGDGLSPKREINVGNNRSSWGSSDGETQGFFTSLIAKDPSRTLDMAAASASGEPGETFRYLNASWAASDLPSYAQWVNAQTAPEVRKVAVNIVANSLMEAGSFQEAGEWAVSSPDSTQSLRMLAWRWGRTDPEAAGAWFREADIPKETKDRLLNQIKAP